MSPRPNARPPRQSTHDAPRSVAALPPGWTWIRLGAIASVQLGKMLSAKARQGKGSRPYLRNINVRWHSIDTSDLLQMDFDPREVEKYRLEVGDVLVCEGGEPGRAAVWNEQLPGALYQKALHRVRLHPNTIDPRLLVYQLELDAGSGVLRGQFTGSTISHLPREAFLEYQVRVPPAQEQRRIVAVIEELLSGIESAKSALLRCQANVRRFRNAARHEAVVLARQAAAQRGEPWPRYALGDLATIGTGATPLRSNTAYYAGGAIPWVTSGALNASVVTTPTEMVTDLALAETNLTVYPAGTLLVAMYGEGRTRGKCAELGIDAATNQAIAAIRLNPDCADAKDWVRLVLDASYDDMRRAASGGVQPNLNLGIIRRIPVPMPPAEVRRELLGAVAAKLEAADRLAAVLDLQLRRVARLRHAVIRAAMQGELTARPEVESIIASPTPDADPVPSTPSRRSRAVARAGRA